MSDRVGRITSHLLNGGCSHSSSSSSSSSSAGGIAADGKHLSRKACSAATGANSGPVPTDVSALPLPPVMTAADGIFPKFPEMLAHMKEVGGVFSYEIIGGRRITIIAEPELYEVVFSPDVMGATPGVDDAVKVEMEKLAHAWFGIPRGICAYTRDSLDSVRKALGPRAVAPLVNQVGAGVEKVFAEMGAAGETDLVNVAHGTFWGVNQAMFGAKTIGPELTPNANDMFHAFDEHIPEITGGMPPGMFPDMQEAAAGITGMFQKSIAAGNHLDRAQCPILHDRFSAIPADAMAGFDDEERAKFMLSIYWAPQANTLPLTFWTLAHILADPAVKARVEAEVRTGAFKNSPNAAGEYAYEEDALPYVHGCMKEALRLYVANLTHRTVSRDIPVKRSDGTWFRVPAKDMLSVASYTRHYDEDVFEDPTAFRPERWLTGKHAQNEFFPFALGKWSCSGKFLAMGEIPLLTALFFRDFDATMEGPLPEADWDRVVASVRPQGWPHDIGCKITYTRRAAP